MKDDSGAPAGFFEQGSSASQMTEAKETDVIARVPDCAGQAADAESTHTQVTLEDAPKIAQNSSQKCPHVYIYICMYTSSTT